jgi:hypothetical protein
MTKKISILTVLLIIAIGFWLWSREFLKERMMEKNMGRDMIMQEYVPTGEPISDIEMDSEIDAALMLDSELELRSIDGEF